MHVQPGQFAPSPLTTEEAGAVNPVRGTMISLGFWLCLLGAIGTYGLVVLSPKVVRWTQKRNEVAANQQQLVALQDQVAYWTQLTNELERNKDFRDSFLSPGTSSTTPSHGVIPLESSLRYQAFNSHLILETPPHEPSLLLRICQRVAASWLLQIIGLATSAGLLLFSFTSLLESRSPRQPRKVRRLRPHFVRRLEGLGSRYVSGQTNHKSRTTRTRHLMTDV